MFWMPLIFGWLIVSTILSIGARILIPLDTLTNRESWIVGISIHLLAVLAGFAFARSRTRVRSNLRDE